MRILQVCPKFHPYVASGSTNVAYHISKELAKKGHSVTVYTSNMRDKYNRIISSDGVEELDGVKIRRFKAIVTIATREMKFFVTPTIFKMLKSELQSFDIIHLHESTTFQNIATHHYAKKYGVPYVLQVHGSLPRVGAWRKLKWIYDALFGYRLLRDAAKVIALSPVEVKQYRRMGVPEGKIVIIPNGIDLAEYATLPPKGCFKRKFGIPEEKKIILYLGRIHKTKGIDLLIKAYTHLVKNMGVKDAVLVIAGPDDGYLGEVKSLVQGLCVSNSVLFTGPLYGKDKISAYIDSEVYVLPSRYETFPMTVLEAYACGKPVIASNVGGLRDLVIDRETGLLFELENIKQLARNILYLLNGNDEAKEMGLKGKKFVKENFTIERIVTKLEKAYEEIVKGKVL